MTCEACGHKQSLEARREEEAEGKREEESKREARRDEESGTEARREEERRQRAEAVRRFMSAQGVPLNRMATISYGKSQPVADNNTRYGRAQNRCAVIVVLA